MNSKSLDQSRDDFDEKIEVQNEKRLSFINKLARTNRKSFQQTWLNTVTKEKRKELEEKYSQAVGNSRFKFKYLFQIPQIINNPKLQQRKKTYEIFTKNSQLEQYYLQLKKASSGVNRQISSKADYKDILSQISNNKVQDSYAHQFKNHSGVILANELWSQKVRNQIYDQSRLKELSELMEMNKIKMSYDDQLLLFEKYFNAKIKPKKQSLNEMKQIIQSAFFTGNNLSPQSEQKEQPKTLISYFKNYDEFTQDYSTKHSTTKHSRMASRNQSQGYRPKSQEMSFISGRASTSQPNPRMFIIPQSTSPSGRLNQIVQDTEEENKQTKATVKHINNFLKQEKEIQEKIQDEKMQKFRIQALKNAIKLKKNRETNSHIVK